jgi:argininosuccinate lyase
LALADVAAGTATPNAELLLTRARANFSTATELADLLVRKGGFDFRTAHHVAGAVVRMLMDRGLGAHQATLEMVDEATRQEGGRGSGLTPEEVAEALDPVRAVRARNRPGGTAPDEVRRMVAEMTGRLAEDEAVVTGWQSKLGAAAHSRRDAVASLSQQALPS